MAQKRLPFRFRIPWKSEASVPHPAAESSSRHPKKKTKSPFRPPGIAPFQPQPQTTQSRSRSIAHETTAPSSSTSQKLETDAGNSETQCEEQSNKFHQSEEMVKLTGRQQMTDTALNMALREEKKQSQTPPETVERQIVFATSNSTGKDIKVLSSTNPKVSNVSCISPQKPLLPNAGKAPSQKEIKGVSNCDHKLATGRLTQPMDENPFSVTTLAGDNRGATMNIGSKSGKKETLIPIYRAYQKNAEQRPEVNAEEEESSEEESSGNSVENEIGNAYVNSNIQSLNNSWMCGSSINDRDPGVHLTLPQKHVEVVKRDEKRGPEIRKPEVNVSRNDGLRIRRRCLRGLLAEPSDSDPDNPNKPQRHGCKYKCGDI